MVGYAHGAKLRVLKRQYGKGIRGAGEALNDHFTIRSHDQIRKSGMKTVMCSEQQRMSANKIGQCIVQHLVNLHRDIPSISRRPLDLIKVFEFYHHRGSRTN
jgi:hypothetical protein